MATNLPKGLETLYKSFDNLRYHLVSGKLETNLDKLFELKRYNKICNEIVTKSLVAKEVYDLMMDNTLKIYQDSFIMNTVERNLCSDFVITQQRAQWTHATI